MTRAMMMILHFGRGDSNIQGLYPNWDRGVWETLLEGAGTSQAQLNAVSPCSNSRLNPGHLEP